jgi:hypothetical protein
MTLSKPLQIFLLYARSDQETVHRLYQRLVNQGADVWFDQEKLFPGQDWQKEIHKAIFSSDIVIVCLSEQFNRHGGYRHEELRIALAKANSLTKDEIFLIPARLEMCDTPEPLRRWQRVDLFEGDGFKKMMNALKQLVALT